MYQEVACPLCGHAGREPVYPATRPQGPLDPEELGCTSGTFARYDAVVKCTACGLLYTSPRPAGQEILDGYRRVEDTGFVAERGGRERTFRRLLRSLAALTGGRRGRLLDAGCALGFFLDQARHDGWEVEGIEPSHWAAEHARTTFGLDVREGPIAGADLPEGAYDAVTLWDVVEHLVDPVGDVATLARALKPGGVFALSTHSIESLAARVLGPRYPFLMAMHVTHFTPRTIDRLLAAAGLVPIGHEPHVRILRLGYVIKKVALSRPRLAAALAAVARATGIENRHLPIVGLGIFNAYARKPDGRRSGQDH